MIVTYFFVFNFLKFFSPIKHKIISNTPIKYLIQEKNNNFSCLKNINKLYNDSVIEGILIDENALYKTITKHQNYPLLNKMEKYLYLNDYNSININKYNIQKKISNELKFLFFRNTKVYIHIEQLITGTNIFHIGISFKNIRETIRYDLAGMNIQYLRFANTDNNIIKRTLFWDYSNKTLKEITDYESKLDTRYLLGIYDCRHYVRQLTNWATNNPTPIWKLDKLI